MMQLMNTLHQLTSSAVRAPTSTRRSARGFTFVEVLTTTTLIGTLMALGVPAFGSGLANVKLGSAANTLLFDLYLARSEAIKRNAHVVLCKSIDGETCEPDGGWEQGSIVFHDNNNNGTRDPTEAVIHKEQATSADLRINGNQNVIRYVSYDPQGRSKLASGAFQAGTITFCRRSAEPTEARQIVINSDGRPRIQKIQVAECD